jgi:hypothetical protein
MIRQMSRANPLWGAPRIHGELLKLGIEVSQATVGRHLVWSKYRSGLRQRLTRLKGAKNRSGEPRARKRGPARPQDAADISRPKSQLQNSLGARAKRTRGAIEHSILQLCVRSGGLPISQCRHIQGIALAGAKENTGRQEHAWAGRKEHPNIYKAIRFLRKQSVRTGSLVKSISAESDT